VFARLGIEIVCARIATEKRRVGCLYLADADGLKLSDDMMESSNAI
jgi:hypothetical protein